MDSDRKLIDRFRSGQRGAFEEIVSEHISAIYRFLVNLTMNREDAEDLCQETFLEADRSAKSYRREGSLRNWLYKIAYRRFLRWRSKRPNTVALEETDIHFNPEGANTLRIDVQNAMSGLSEEMRAVFVLSEVEQFDLLEVASILDIPLGTVKSRLSRSKAALRLALSDPSDGEQHNEPRRVCSSNS